MTTITVADIMFARPCPDYPESRVRALVGDGGVTPHQLAALDIPADDRLWGLIYCAMDDRQRRLLACDCAERALSRVESPDPRSLNAVAVARRYARGDATDEELAAAWDAAWDAAWAAARDAAWDAAWDAARAAGDAAGDAAWDATWAAERKWQIARALELIEGGWEVPR